jgi:ubiquinone/menaquinone biosynthesis C-methylase UbiE
MLEVARHNLQGFENVEFHESDGLSLPLPDESLDAVFANMYLHHCPDPAEAIQEMVRVLRPGGRLVITDMDAHPYEWLKTEMADVWQGFERDQMRAWYLEAGLVNVIVDDTGENCCAESQNTAITNPEKRQAEISTFVAVGTRRVQGVKEVVQAGYGAVAAGQGGCCSGPSAGEASSCCSGTGMDQLITIDDTPGVRIVPGYTPVEQAQVPQEAAEIALGCGNPTAFAGLKPGEVVLDIGSGGGMDAFLAARQVGEGGRVIGVDMTPEMLVRARQAAQKAGLGQVEFRQGQAEALPFDDMSVDVVISNCVINLCEDKGVVFREAFRVLKDGGRLEVSDMVTDRAYPAELAADPADWPGCVFGALPEGEYLDLVAQAGFKDIQVRRSASMGAAYNVSLYSISVSARKIKQP